MKALVVRKLGEGMLVREEQNESGCKHLAFEYGISSVVVRLFDFREH